MVAAAILAGTMLVHSQNGQNAAGNQTNCQPGQKDTCNGGSSIVPVLATTNIIVCPAETISLCATTSDVLGSIITVTTNTDCSTVTSTNASGPATEGNSWWQATGLVVTNGSGKCASFSVPMTNQGSGTITFYVSYCNSGVCTNCGTNSTTAGYTVNAVSATGSVQFKDPEVNIPEGEPTNVTAVVTAVVKTCCRDGEPIVLQVDIVGRCGAGFTPSMLGTSGYHMSSTVGSYSSTADQTGYVILSDPNHPETYSAYSTGYSRFVCIHWTVKRDCSATITVAQPPRPAQGQPRNCP